MTIRKLASIRRIAEIKPIPEADAIEAVRVDGWWVVAKKGEYRVDDRCLYLEIDSWVPTALAPFLTKGGQEPREHEGVKGERLRTVKLRGQVSQGLVLPIEGEILHQLCLRSGPGARFSDFDGLDLTEPLGILKYEPPIPAQLAGQVKGNFPSFIRKTDQERIQNLPDWFEKYRDVLWEVTVKLDGSSMTVYHNNGDTGVCSRNLDLTETEGNTLWTVANRYDILPALRTLGRNVALQGELIGEGIQGNPEKLRGQEFFLFDIWDIDQQRHLTAPERNKFLLDLTHAGCHLFTVPVLEPAFWVFKHYPTMADLLWYAGSGSSLNASIREGLVFKATQPINGEVPSFKAINNAYLLKEK